MWLAAHLMMSIHGGNKCLRLAEISRTKRIEFSRGKNAFWYGKHLSDETRKKISESQKGKIIPMDVRKKMSIANTGSLNGFWGKHHSLETRKRWSIQRKGRVASEETRLKMSQSFKGRVPWNKGIPTPDYVKNKIGLGNKGKFVSEETRIKLSIANKGKKPTKEQVEKMRYTLMYSNPKSKMVVQYDKDMNFVAEFISSREASRITGISCGNISRCCNGKLKTVKGFVWRYK